MTGQREGRARARVRRGMVMQEVALARHGNFFRADTPVYAETGAVVWFDDGELVVEHPDGVVTRHRGTWILDDHIPGHVALTLKFEVGADDVGSD